ncbi:MAG: ion channel [Campylobacterales bacterium]|nr:ion channel [Campylobacterales bacterium]
MNFFSRVIVDLAYFLHTSDAYQHKKRLVYDLLENNKNHYKQYFDIFMIALIFLSVAILIAEVKHEVPIEIKFFNSYVISIIFFIEYILRFWISSSVCEIIINKSEHDTMLGREFSLFRAIIKVVKAKLIFIFSFRAIIDLLAILPFFHELRLLRLFVLFRVFKLFRYATSFQIFASVLYTKKFEFLILFMYTSIVISVSSILMYVMEANNPASKVNTLFDAVYWSVVTIATVGYGDIIPITIEGRVVAIAVIFAGISLIAFTTSIVVSALNEKLDDIREIKTIEDIRKLKQFYLICGYENVAQEVAKKLKDGVTNIIVLDEDEHRIANAKRDGLVALNYDPGDAQSYKIIGIDLNTQVKAVLCLRESDVENVYTTLTVRSMNKNVNIVSLLMDDSNRKKLDFAGVNEILYPKGLVGMISKELIGRPVAFEVIHALRNDYYGVSVEEILVDDRMSQKLIYVHELNNHKFKIVLLGIFKKDKKRFFFNPIDATMLESGDYLLVIGKSIFIKEFEKHLHKKIKYEK